MNIFKNKKRKEKYIKKVIRCLVNVNVTLRKKECLTSVIICKLVKLQAIGIHVILF